MTFFGNGLAKYPTDFKT